MQQTMIQTSQKHLIVDKRKYKSWMTYNILNFMSNTREIKDKELIKYNKTQRLIRQKIRQAKQNDMQEKFKFLRRNMIMLPCIKR